MRNALERLDAVGQAVQTRSQLWIRAPDPVVDDLDDGTAVFARDLDGDRRSVRVLGDVGERLGNDVVGRGLDPPRQPSHRQPVHLTGSGARSASDLGRSEPPLGEHSRMDAPSELAELLERKAELAFASAISATASLVSPFFGCACASRNETDTETSRCWAPSWRFRSSRRRSLSPATPGGLVRQRVRLALPRSRARGRPTGEGAKPFFGARWEQVRRHHRRDGGSPRTPRERDRCGDERLDVQVLHLDFEPRRHALVARSTGRVGRSSSRSRTWFPSSGKRSPIGNPRASGFSQPPTMTARPSGS